jgi:hypothetical protein
LYYFYSWLLREAWGTYITELSLPLTRTTTCNLNNATND